MLSSSTDPSVAASLTYDAPNANEDPRLAVIADSEARAVWVSLSIEARINYVAETSCRVAMSLPF